MNQLFVFPISLAHESVVWFTSAAPQIKLTFVSRRWKKTANISKALCFPFWLHTSQLFDVLILHLRFSYNLFPAEANEWQASVKLCVSHLGFKWVNWLNFSHSTSVVQSPSHFSTCVHCECVSPSTFACSSRFF